MVTLWISRIQFMKQSSFIAINKLSKPSLTRLKQFIMTALDFNDRGHANVSFSEFDNYMNERREHGDYTEEKNGITYYYNCGGCLLAKYDNNEGYGFTY